MLALLPWMGLVRRSWVWGGAKPQAAILVVMVLSAAAFAAGPDESTRVESVVQTFDKQPFDYGMKLLSRKSGYRIYRLTYPSPVVTPVAQNNTIPADYYLPDGITPGDPPRPAVICLHILEGDFELVHITCSVLATRGIPAIMFKLPYYGERGLPGGPEALAGNPELFAGALQQALQDVRRTVDVLASRPEIDAKHIGITGISLGGIVAGSAAGSEPRLTRAVLLLAGGDLLHIIHHARETRTLSTMIRRLPAEQRADIEKRIRKVDPLAVAAALGDRARRGKVLMINASEDNVVPPACTKKLAAALGITERVVWLDGLGHYTAMAALPRALQTMADFFAEDLPPGVQRAAPVAAKSPVAKVVGLMQQAGAAFTAEPKPGRCHLIDLAATATLPDGEKYEATLRLVRGPKYRFNLHAKIPRLGEAALGQDRLPWMASGEKAVFVGKLPPGTEPEDPLQFIDRHHLMTLKMAAGLLAAVALAPDMLEAWATIEDDTSVASVPAVRIADKRGGRDRARIEFQPDGKTPRRLTFDVQGVQGTITFRAWQLDALAHATFFQPPNALPQKEVDAGDLYRMFSALVNFAMESLE
ncbi:MAG: prolyl oligopeptidase family serine peptidase [Candidatus Nealsonbacteria bacterium]|nr:prolyl oligopeptidase family serine peptidase [Candidatus Nealsonbacteria bacterium]